MAEYIEREAAIKEIGNDSPEQVGYSREDAADCIRYMQAADVAPVVHGRWKPFGIDSRGRVRRWNCTACHMTSRDGGNYCPYCGARMDGDDHEK